MNKIKYIMLNLLLINIFNNLSSKELKFTNIKDLNYIRLSEEFLLELKDILKFDKVIETGTCLGASTAIAAKVVSEVHSIELSQDLYNKSCQNLQNYTNVKLYWGDSGKILIDAILDDKPTLFWLDGHYSGVYSNQDTALGEKNTPIIKELQTIKKANLKNAIILIDDIRVFDKRLKDLNNIIIGGYPDFNKISKIIKDINPNYQVLLIDDALLAFPANNHITISPVLKACTISRTSTNLEEILEAEKIISLSENSERQAIINLYNHFCGDWDYSFKVQGLGDYYALWYTLLLINDKKYSQALNILNDLENKNFDKERVIHYKIICQENN